MTSLADYWNIDRNAKASAQENICSSASQSSASTTPYSKAPASLMSTKTSLGLSTTASTTISIAAQEVATTSITLTDSYISVPTDLALADVHVVIPLDCPNLSGTKKTVSPRGKSYTFQLQCGRDYNDGTVIDILAATAYSLEDCLRACATYNINLRRDACVGVSFNASK